MVNTKKLYKFNAKKFVLKCESEKIDTDFEWAFKNNGAIVKFNDKVGFGALDGKLIPLSLCDEYNGMAITNETNTELETVLHETAQCAVADLYEAEEVIEELVEELEKTKDFIDDLMKYHAKVLTIVNKHREELSEEFHKEIFEEVFSKVMVSILKKGL